LSLKHIGRSTTRGQAEREQSLTQILNICNDFKQWDTATQGQVKIVQKPQVILSQVRKKWGQFVFMQIHNER
jgi:hypothetical protein